MYKYRSILFLCDKSLFSLTTCA